MEEEEGQERDTSSDVETQMIYDDDNDGSPTDVPDLWIRERNESDTKFERSIPDPIPRDEKRKNRP